MNMMDMAKMEEAIEQAWIEYWSEGNKWKRTHLEFCPKMSRFFEKGFRDGVAFAQSQERSALARYMVGVVALIATERMLQIEEKGWTPEHDGQHADCELIQAAEYYCAYDKVAFEVCHLEEYKGLIEDKFPSTWDERWKKRRGFPDPTDYDLAKAGALIAAELDRRARERELNGTTRAVSVLNERQSKIEGPFQALGNVSQYPAAAEEPEGKI